MERFYGADEIAQVLTVSRDTAEDIIKACPRFAANGKGSKRPIWRVRENDLLAYIRDQMVYPDEVTEMREERRTTMIKNRPDLFEADGRIKRRA